ncbi:MAG: P-type conjugative transfer protein TrbG, partial [Acetobacteraceae bacterium]
MRVVRFSTLWLMSISLGACATTWRPPAISYDNTPKRAVLLPGPPKPVRIVEVPKVLPLPGQLKRLPGISKPPPESPSPRVRVDKAKCAARVQP